MHRISWSSVYSGPTFLYVNGLIINSVIFCGVACIVFQSEDSFLLWWPLCFCPTIGQSCKNTKKKKTTNYNTFSVFQSYLKLPCLDKIRVEMKNSYAEKINFVFAGNMPDSNSANLFLLSQTGCFLTQ